jgi:hypothetical protein
MAASFTGAKMWKQPRCVLMGEYVNTMWRTHTVKYYSAMKREGILTHGVRWTNLEDFMLSDISQSQKEKYCMIPLSRVVKFKGVSVECVQTFSVAR